MDRQLAQRAQRGAGLHPVRAHDAAGQGIQHLGHVPADGLQLAAAGVLDLDRNGLGAVRELVRLLHRVWKALEGPILALQCVGGRRGGGDEIRYPFRMT